MEQITAKNLTKKFKHAVKEPGFKGAVKHLFTQNYREKTAVDNINLSIKEGEAVAYIGPNGAGKSTTIKMLSGILIPTSGEITIDGLVPSKNREQNAMKIGAVFGQRTQLWWDLPVIESFNLLKDIYELPDAAFKQNMELFNDVLGLNDFISLSARKISLGQRMRADLAASLLHNPKILYLDEPTIGLDISVKEKIREFIKQINKSKGTTVLLTTHDLDDIQDICERIIIIDFGKIVYDGTLKEVKDKYARERTIHIQLFSPSPLLAKKLSSLKIKVHNASNTSKNIDISFDRMEVSAQEVLSQVILHAEVQDFQIDEPKIDSVIKKVYERSLNIT